MPNESDSTDNAEIYLIGQAGYKSGLNIRPIRTVVGRNTLRSHLTDKGILRDHGNHVQVKLGYRDRVYRCFPDKSPKKLGEAKLLALLAEDDQVGEVSGSSRRDVDPDQYRRGQILKYSELKDLPDKSLVWVQYRSPEDGEYLIDSLHRIRRSFSQSSQADPAWKAADVAQTQYWELYRQPPAHRAAADPCVDADGMTLFKAVRKRLPG